MVTLLLKKSYRHKDLKEIKFNDLWNTHGVFTTMRISGKPGKILFFKEHINNLIRSLKIYKIKKKNIKKNILHLINLNFEKNKKYAHLLRIASNKKMISISLRKRFKTKKNFILHLINYKRIQAMYKNLKYRKILSILNKMDTTKNDIALYKNKKILETGTSNLLFVGKIKILKKDIIINSLNEYDEIIVVGSGKGVTSVSVIKNTKWRRKSFKYYRILLKIYQQAVMKCPRYNG